MIICKRDDTNMESKITSKTKEYIANGWDKCIRRRTHDDGTLIGLPYPYTVPGIGHFDEMYYWDTYFTNAGLIASGLELQAKYNVDNMLYMISRFGYMPNGNRTYYLGRSLPPFLSQMVREVYDVIGDNTWLTGAYSALEREHEFWMKNRTGVTGLATYDASFPEEDTERYSGQFKSRVQLSPDMIKDIISLRDMSRHDMARHYLAMCESGWDCNPRCEFAMYDYVQIDLNSLLYMLESNMAYFSERLGNGKAEIWEKRAETRRALMRKYMRNKDGLYLDYNFVEKKFSPVFSAASFYPLFAGIADEEEAKAAVSALCRLEAEYGVYACEPGHGVPGVYQWDAPNGWACLQYMTVFGLARYGYEGEAKRIAKKYLSLVDKVLEETGGIWEKYNIDDGSINVKNEYEMPKMMGWSAGVYLALDGFVNRDKS